MSADGSVVESFPNPHANTGDAERDALDGEPGPGDNIAAHRRTKIKRSDLDFMDPAIAVPNAVHTATIIGHFMPPMRILSHVG